MHFAGAQMWAATLNSIDSNIVMIPVEMQSVGEGQTYQSPGLNPIPIYTCGETGGPDASSAVDWVYKEGGGQSLRESRVDSSMDSKGNVQQMHPIMDAVQWLATRRSMHC